MAGVRGTRGVSGDGTGPVRPRGSVFEDIEPSHAWTEDSNGHYLLVDLPDFKKEQVKIQVSSSGDIKINGEKAVSETKRIRFEQTFKAPEKSNTDAITAKFDGEAQILYLTVPKRKVDEKREPPKSEPEHKPKPTGLKHQQSDKKATEENATKKPDTDGTKIKDDIARGTNQDHKPKENDQIRGPQNSRTSDFWGENVRRWARDPEPSYLRNALEMLSKNKGIVVTAIVAFSLGMFISRKFEPECETFDR